MKIDDAYSFENLSQIVKTERGKSLVKLPADFYEMFAHHTEELKSRFQKENAKDSASPTAMLLADEVLKTQRMLEEMVRRRRRKIVLAALGEGRDGPVAPNELMPMERMLFDELVAVFRKDKSSIDRLFGAQPDASKGGPDIAPINIDSVLQIAKPEPEAPAHATPAAPAEKAAHAPKGPAVQSSLPEARKPAAARPEPATPAPKQSKESKEKKDAPGASQGKQDMGQGYTMVRVLADMDSFLAPDKRSYKLRKEDVLELPSQIAELLKSKKKVEIFTA